MSKIYKTQTKEHTTTHDQSKIRIYTCATNDKPPLDLKDEFFALESHLHYLCHQLVPGNTSFNYHQTPPLSRKQTTKKTKDLPKAKTPQKLPTSLEPTQPRSLDKDLINELRKLRKLKMNPSKARILRNTINFIHLAKRLKNTHYKEAEKTDSTTPSQENGK